MTTPRLSFAIAATFMSVLAGTARTDEELLEYYPTAIHERLLNVERERRTELEAKGVWDKEGVVNILKLWTPGTTVTIGFPVDSEDALCMNIVRVAERWTEHGNLRFSYQTEDGKIRRWSKADQEYSTDIRVDFGGPLTGYYSVTGTDSRHRRIVRPYEPSINFERFHVELPRDWETVVLHEFGHAIGFFHEHQYPTIPCAFRMKDDPGYEPTKDPSGAFIPDSNRRRPGAYTRLGGRPNCWDRKTVDQNLKRLTGPSNAFLSGEFDRESVMIYRLPSWLFQDGTKSHCYIANENTGLSDTDKEMVLKAYPRSQVEIDARKRLLNQVKASALFDITIRP
jgi:hypothetical protein